MKILVAHPQQQHSYMLARALLKAGHDVTYMTTVYGKPGSMTRLVTRLLSGESKVKAEGRYMPDFPDERVAQRYEFLGLLSLLLLRVDKSKKRYNALNHWIDQHFGLKVAKLAKSGGYDAVVCYNEHAVDAFRELRGMAPGIVRVLDVSASMKPYHAKLFFEDIEGCFGLPPSRKREFVEYFKDGLGEAFDEVALTDYFLVPSQHVKDSLVYCGAQTEAILRCPYGSYFEDSAMWGDTVHRPMRFVFCGRVSMPKGAHHLLDAFEGLDPSTYELTLIGGYDNSDGFFDPYLSRHNFTGAVLKSRVKEIYSEQDVMVFPTLTDGMSLACLEALSCGLPLVTTKSNGASDFVEEGVNGFVLEPGDVADLKNCILWCIEHPAEIALMKSAARKSAEGITWDAYGEKVAAAFELIGSRE